MTTLKWKDIVRGKLYHDQAGKCADCGQPITSEWQKWVKLKTPVNGGGSGSDFFNLKLVHRDCSVMKRKPQADRAKIINTLVEQGIGLDSIARALGISLRTVYRYVKHGKGSLVPLVDLPLIGDFYNINQYVQPDDIYRILEIIDKLS